MRPRSMHTLCTVCITCGAMVECWRANVSLLKRTNKTLQISRVRNKNKRTTTTTKIISVRRSTCLLKSNKNGSWKECAFIAPAPTNFTFKRGVRERERAQSCTNATNHKSECHLMGIVVMAVIKSCQRAFITFICCYYCQHDCLS